MWSNKYISIPFKEHGRSREGVDCWGLASVIYKEEFNVDLPLLTDYSTTKDRGAIAKLCNEESKKWINIPEGEEQPFDVLIFKILNIPCHVGIVISKGVMIHCEYGIGTHLTEYEKEFQWSKRLAGIYRYTKH